MRGWGGGCIWRRDFTYLLLFLNQSIINFVPVLILRSSERAAYNRFKQTSYHQFWEFRPTRLRPSIINSELRCTLLRADDWRAVVADLRLFFSFLQKSSTSHHTDDVPHSLSLSLSVQRGGVLSCGVLLHSSCKKEHPLPFLPRRCAKKETSNDRYVVGDFSNLDGHLSVSQNLWRHFFSPLFFLLFQLKNYKN